MQQLSVCRPSKDKRGQCDLFPVQPVILITFLHTDPVHAPSAELSAPLSGWEQSVVSETVTESITECVRVCMFVSVHALLNC